MAGAFLWDNRVVAGVSISSASSVPATMPLSNLLDPQPRARTRIAAGGGGVFPLLLDLGATVALDCVALVSTTLSAAATLRVRLATADATGAAGDAWDSGEVDAATSAAANGNVVLIRAAGQASGRYLLVECWDGAASVLDIGRIIAGPLWRLQRSHAYGIEEGRMMLDRRDRNPATGAEFVVPAVANPRVAAFTLPVLTTAEARGQHRDMLAAAGAATDGLWIPDLAASQAEINARAIYGGLARPGGAAGTAHAAHPVHRRSFQLEERV